MLCVICSSPSPLRVDLEKAIVHLRVLHGCARQHVRAIQPVSCRTCLHTGACARALITLASAHAHIHARTYTIYAHAKKETSKARKQHVHAQMEKRIQHVRAQMENEGGNGSLRGSRKVGMSITDSPYSKALSQGARRPWFAPHLRFQNFWNS